ncbi:hypothetical protein CDL15_Pgr012849 [Punica granatum]|uniref:RCD1 WWE domain-containing protein n=1 Tax=Punica granatum TaxID=22663 RepID=A0A218XEX9_PUNGR|nr:hypothetical protein CDL15_Pgr012849 [Punica granatum]
MANVRNTADSNEFFLERDAPSRIYFNENYTWILFSTFVTTLAQERFQAKFTTVEISTDEGRFIIDLFALEVINNATGDRKPIGWVDKAGRCFFPHSVAREVELPPPIPQPVGIRQPWNINNVRDAFLNGIEYYAEIQQIKVRPMEGHMRSLKAEVFEQVAEIVKHSRGDSNVVYAWAATDANSLRSGRICQYPGQFGLTVYGFGAILSNIENPHFRPSNDKFDSAVDNLVLPTRYIVWCSNMVTHIYPEYLVRFKVEGTVSPNS